MVSSKTSDPKKRRYTYAESAHLSDFKARELCLMLDRTGTVTAISDIRRQHPRSPIHLKTLRAQSKSAGLASTQVEE